MHCISIFAEHRRFTFCCSICGMAVVDKHRISLSMGIKKRHSCEEHLRIYDSHDFNQTIERTTNNPPAVYLDRKLVTTEVFRRFVCRDCTCVMDEFIISNGTITTMKRFFWMPTNRDKPELCSTLRMKKALG